MVLCHDQRSQNFIGIDRRKIEWVTPLYGLYSTPRTLDSSLRPNAVVSKCTQK